jgi:hypothetical protein
MPWDTTATKATTLATPLTAVTSRPRSGRPAAPTNVALKSRLAWRIPMKARARRTGALSAHSDPNATSTTSGAKAATNR